MARYNEAQRIIVQQLQQSGYTPQEAQEAVRLARTAISFTRQAPRPEALGGGNPLHSRMHDTLITNIRDTLIQAYTTADPLRDVTARLYPRPRREIRMAMVPAPVTTFRHRFQVEVAGRTYTMDSNRDLTTGGIIHRADETDAGRLMALLQNRSVQSSDLRITDERGRIVSRAQLEALVRPRYIAIQREFARAATEGRAPNEEVWNSVEVSRARRT